ncbi:PadR family transcriptional regulator [Mycobacterium bourgelatii]|uniref:PadR family transcriptional regulator n=1 Tax=Mycobacterium bourgelatii TaxID=1273442 RepID=A0A7I9YUW8_MYCBU|nr:PadR family transcriptional regulator [Mycobacterium bourgelatii]MCV6974741.1 helix-turn-helix transcriptional regulator [Mycobacterium bourgelatii]GFG92353.1 PadR family transcriptional regulator [Mycobacterium bourgelatii]
MSQFLRGAVRLHILHHANIASIHGASMADELAGHGYKISPGTLYPTLHRMERDGLLTSRQEVVEGRARRVYDITDLGRQALTEERAALAELAAEILGHRQGR